MHEVTANAWSPISVSRKTISWLKPWSPKMKSNLAIVLRLTLSLTPCYQFIKFHITFMLKTCLICSIKGRHGWTCIFHIFFQCYYLLVWDIYLAPDNSNWYNIAYATLNITTLQCHINWRNNLKTILCLLSCHFKRKIICLLSGNIKSSKLCSVHLWNSQLS